MDVNVGDLCLVTCTTVCLDYGLGHKRRILKDVIFESAVGLVKLTDFTVVQHFSGEVCD